MAADSPSRSRPDAALPDSRQVVGHLAPCLRIAHQIRGRVRLKLDADALAAAPLPPGTAGRLDGLLTGIRGIRNVQVNLLARSCVVEYDTAVIPDAAWPDLLAGRTTPAAEALAAVLQERCAAGN